MEEFVLDENNELTLFDKHNVNNFNLIVWAQYFLHDIDFSSHTHEHLHTLKLNFLYY